MIFTSKHTFRMRWRQNLVPHCNHSWYSRACTQYSDFLERTQLLTQKLLKHGYVVPRLKPSLQNFYGRHHNLVHRYDISISQMTMGHLLFTDLTSTTWIHPQIFGGFHVAHLFSCLCCSIMCRYVLSSMLWCTLRFLHRNYVRFLCTSSCV